MNRHPPPQPATRAPGCTWPPIHLLLPWLQGPGAADRGRRNRTRSRPAPRV